MKVCDIEIRVSDDFFGLDRVYSDLKGYPIGCDRFEMNR
jgi:hypothetical protein